MADEDDIESFIQQQKAKLANDRHSIGNLPNGEATDRRKWEKAGPVHQPLEQNGTHAPEETSLPLGTYDNRKQPQRDRTSKANQNSMRTQSPEETGLPLGSYQRHKQKLQQERSREYNDFLKQKDRIRTVPNRQQDAVSHVQQAAIKTVSDEDVRRQYEAEQRKQTHVNSTTNADDIGASLPIQDRHSAQRRAQILRNQEYNEMIRQKDLARKHRTTRGREQDSVIEGRHAVIPSEGGHSTQSIEPSRQQRNRPQVDEYMSEGEMDYRSRREQGPRKGWGTPTYEEILEQKRREEMQFRKHDDPTIYSRPAPGMRLGGDNYMRSSVSDGFLNEDRLRGVVDNQRLGDLDREYETKKRQADYDRRHDNSLVNVLDSAPIKEFNHWQGRPRGVRFEEDLPTRNDSSPPSRRRSEPAPPSQPHYQQNPQDSDFKATLLVGHEDPDNVKVRKKEVYRKELERQMAETQAAKKREKMEDLKNAALNAEQSRQQPYGSSHQKPGPTPQSHPGPPHPQPQTGYQPTYRTQSEPYQQQYQPTIATDNSLYGTAGSNLPSYNSPLEEAYHYYGMRNPLEGGGSTVPPLNLHGIIGSGYQPPPQSGQLPPSSQPKQHSQSQSQPSDLTSGRSPRRKDFEGHGNLMVSPASEQDQRSKSRVDKASYQAQLQHQMEEKKRLKEKQKREQVAYDRKMEAEIANYDPFGKGGAGAPMKDREGNIMADLKRMHRENKDIEEGTTPRRPAPQSQPTQNTYSEAAAYGRGVGAPPAGQISPGRRDEPDSFGQVVVAKTATEKYKEELQKQIDEKKRKEADEKEKIRLEEEREQKRIDDERIKMQNEFEVEQKKQRTKGEEVNRKNEEMRKDAEDKKKEAEYKRKEQEEKRLDELRIQQERERLERLQDRESGSPPIPTIRSKTEMPQTAQLSRTNSPPVPAKQTAIRSQSADVLNQLASMRRQLQSERKRVENALENQKYDVDVFDPRTAPRPAPAQPSKPEIDVFELARNKHPVKPPTADSMNPNALKDFNDLKYRKNTESRAQFRSIFPEVPSSNDALETQQMALLRQQEEFLERKKKSQFDSAMPDMSPKALGLIREESPGTMLQADSAFIEVGHSIEALPDDLDDLRRNESARQRRRQRLDSPRRHADNYSLGTNNTGSLVSLDPDRITRKNEERLRRLRTMADDGLSIADPDDVLDRFMAKQSHNRPASGTTLNDDSWLRPAGTSGYQ